VFEAVRDLHLITRVAGWLFFGGIERSSSFTEMEASRSEECKLYPEGKCPYFLNPANTACPCLWNDVAKSCDANFSSTEARDLEQGYWVVQSLDADPETGQRNSSPSFPIAGSSPETTQWWGNVSVLPGAEKGKNASGFNTTYDRLRVVSALSSVFFPVYNYPGSLNRRNHVLGLFAAFEDDG